MITIKQARKWVNALRSGKYSQTKGCLQDSKGYCCLGVACDVFIPKSKQVRDCFLYLEGEEPGEQYFAPFWLKEINDDFYRKTGQLFDLVHLNDKKRYSFDEIADIIEMVYILKVLE